MIEAIQLVEANFPWLLPLIVFIFGAVVGSFLNVCIYRIPEERSIVIPGSTCACGQPIRFFHNIPIFSWLFLRGRAACCEARFSVRYPLVELITALLFTASWMQLETVPALLGMLFIAILLCATFIDFDHMIMPTASPSGHGCRCASGSCFPAMHAVEASIPLLGRIESGLIAITGALVGSGLVYWIAVLGEIVFGNLQWGGRCKIYWLYRCFLWLAGSCLCHVWGCCWVRSCSSLGFLPCAYATLFANRRPSMLMTP